MATLQKRSLYEDIPLKTNVNQIIIPSITPKLSKIPREGASTIPWATQSITLLCFFLLVVFHKAFSHAKLWTPTSPKEQNRRPTQVPSSIPVIGNLLSFLFTPQKLAKFIPRQLGQSGIFSLNMLMQDIFIVSGSEYLNAVWKDAKKVMMSHDELNLAISHMFDVPSADMAFYRGDRTGSAHESHPLSPARDADHRNHYLTLKTVAEYLTGANLTATAQRYQNAISKELDTVHVDYEWVEMDDLFSFVRRHVANATVETLLGSGFVAQFPDFIDNFYVFNSKVQRFVMRWPTFLLRKECRARKRCIEIMRQWRKTMNVQQFDGSPMFLKNLESFQNWGLSDDAIACSDLAILWGTFSNAVILSFWLTWHTFQDRQLLAAVTSEIEKCRSHGSGVSTVFDTAKLSSQQLLQSIQAETLRKYVAVYISRTTEYGSTQILDYQIPKNKMLLINSQMAHMDERNWELGAQHEHPVEEFWGERFLTTEKLRALHPTKTNLSDGSLKEDEKSIFSMSEYKGAFVPFGGGVHQCPARHWVKAKMLNSLATILGSFEIELLDSKKELRVDLAKYGLGALNPGEKAPFRIRRKRSSDAKI